MAENWISAWPAAYLIVVIWLAIAASRHARSGSFAPLDFVVIGLWFAIGTAGLIGRLRRNRRKR
ncbi:putative RND superfamily exporter protein [Curtobacterium pusillum]|uniref:RND superfamily exporter protein n=1 Tax=Curtobacterium pusillum TaxID=69373 RepID=A0AAW3T5P1_9MICO|nr:putative RND superfamily exporter protein [Curtobacterium pusillum]